VQLQTVADDCVVLIVKDDGVGAKVEEDAESSSLGLQLVRTLARQIHADLLIRPGAGTTVELNFRRQA